MSLVLHSSHQTLRSPVNSVGDGVVGWYVSGGVRWSFWNNQTGQVEFFVFFLGEVRELVDGQGEFVSVHSVVKVDIFALFLPDGISMKAILCYQSYQSSFWMIVGQGKYSH